MKQRKIKLTAEELAQLQNVKDSAELDFRNAKLAFYHRTEYKGVAVTYEVLRSYAELLIAHNYAYQKAIYGTIKVKISVARLMRR